MDQITWIIHGVFDEGGITYHTHGLHKYGSLELELNLSLNKKQAMEFIYLIGLQIAGGKRYRSGDMETEIFTLPFYLLETRPIQSSGPDDERVLRIIFPDENLHYPWDKGCSPPYKSQLLYSEIKSMRHLLEVRQGIVQ